MNILEQTDFLSCTTFILFNFSNSWETIFSKSSDIISHAEMASCRRIVQLCRDCLLIVYQFAAEAKSAAGQNNLTESEYTVRPSRSGHVQLYNSYYST